MKRIREIMTATRQGIERTLFGATAEEHAAALVARIQEHMLDAFERAFERAFEVSEAYENAYDATYQAALARGLSEDDAHAEASRAAEAADAERTDDCE